MKLFLRIILFFSIVSILFYSCDPNDNDSPLDDPRDRFIGNWICSETSSENGSSSFTVTISLKPDNSTQILLSNFYQLGTAAKVYAIVAGTYATIPEQTVSGFSIKGNGTLINNNTRIDWTYQVSEADLDDCTAVYTK